MKAHLLVNLFRPDAVEAARNAVMWLQAHGIEVCAERESADIIEVPIVSQDDFGQADFVIAIGGDGTLIKAAHMIGDAGTPILGAQYGRFGFVTQIGPGELEGALQKYVDGELSVVERMMIQTDLVRDGTVVATLHSLNETVVQRSATTRMLTFDVHVDGSEVSRYPADGVMVSTPTGSTAYNLSAGGPVVDPRMKALILTAIMPHTLSARSLILQPEAVVEIKVESREEAVLSCDGHSRLHLLTGDFVRITMSARTTKLLTPDVNSFFDKLSDRLLWSQGPI